MVTFFCCTHCLWMWKVRLWSLGGVQEAKKILLFLLFLPSSITEIEHRGSWLSSLIVNIYFIFFFLLSWEFYNNKIINMSIERVHKQFFFSWQFCAIEWMCLWLRCCIMICNVFLTSVAISTIICYIEMKLWCGGGDGDDLTSIF